MTADVLQDNDVNDDGNTWNQQRHHLPLHWLQPKTNIDDTSVPLPSFSDLKAKTNETLYYSDGDGYTTRRKDKSPKGFVDTPIQHLVDLINHHPNLCTLSSCSGRTSIFDPNSTEGGGCDDDENGENDNNDTMNNQQQRRQQQQTTSSSSSGKGRGKWRFVSHTIIKNRQDVIDALTIQENDNDEHSQQHQQQHHNHGYINLNRCCYILVVHL